MNVRKHSLVRKADPEFGSSAGCVEKRQLFINCLVLGGSKQTVFSRTGVDSRLVGEGGRLDQLVAEGEQLGPDALAGGNG